MTLDEIKTELTNAKAALVDVSGYVSQAEQQLQQARQHHARAAADVDYWQRRLNELQRKPDEKSEPEASK